MKGGLSIPWPCLVKLKPRLRPPTSAAGFGLAVGG